jgi:hypothetical protein
MTMETMPVDTDRVVTRVEVIDHIGEAFTTGSLTRADLMAAASRSGARSAVVDLLGRLPDRKFSRPHDLWDNLADVPIEL